MRRNGAAQALAGIVAVAAGAAAVIVGAADEGLHLDRTSFTSGPEIQMMAASAGVLRGDRATGCLWLEGPTGDRMPLVLTLASAGTDFAATPPAVRTQSQVFAHFGDSVSVGGGYDKHWADPECAALGTPFVAWQIERN